MPSLLEVPPPLYVDLDGTLVSTDTLWESFVAIARQKPGLLLPLLPILLKGKVPFKTAIASQTPLSAADLPYHPDILAFLMKEKASGRQLILATATHEDTAEKIANHLGIFDHVIASDDKTNLKGVAKRDAIRTHAKGPYEYLGDHVVDLPIWLDASKAHAVLKPSQTWHRNIPVSQRGERFASIGGSWRSLFRAMRPHQWAKNALLFLPLLLSHTFIYPNKLVAGTLGFTAFCLTASAVYLINDIFDIHSDRHHPEKRHRPFASGAYSIPAGLLVSILLLLGGLGIGASISVAYAFCLLGYIVTTTLYTLLLKKLPVIDVVMIGFFYTYRIFIGAVATQTPVTDWLLAFATFFFVSLGIAKRYGELLLASKTPGMRLSGRGYHTEDLPVLLGFGLNSAFLSLVVLALYVRSTEVTKLYVHPSWLWGVVILLMIWIMRLWLLAHRGIVKDDPLLFTLRDKKSLILFMLMVGVLVAAAV